MKKGAVLVIRVKDRRLSTSGYYSVVMSFFMYVNFRKVSYYFVREITRTSS